MVGFVAAGGGYSSVVGRRRVCKCEVAPDTEEVGGWIRRAMPFAGKSVNADNVEWSVPEMEETPQNLLEEVVWWKSIETDMRKEKVPFLLLRSRVMALDKGGEEEQARGVQLLEGLRRESGEPVKIIADIRRKWPTDEEIDETADVMRQAVEAEKEGAVAISLNTDSKYFGGNLQDMNRVRAAINIPIISTEVINQPYQFYELRYHRADAAITQTAVFPRRDMDYNIRISSVLKMAHFVEVNTEAELDYALSFTEAAGILITSRDLLTLRGSSKGVEAIAGDKLEQIRSRNLIVLTEGPASELDSVPDFVDAMIVYTEN